MEETVIRDNIRFKLLRIAKKEITDDTVNILGKPYYLEPRDLVYLFMDIQEEYNIKIQEQELRNQQFATVDGIVTLIKNIYKANFKKKYVHGDEKLYIF